VKSTTGAILVNAYKSDGDGDDDGDDDNSIQFNSIQFNSIQIYLCAET
jgi:hypothetical protein